MNINEDLRLIGFYSSNSAVNDITKYLYLLSKNGTVMKVTGVENYRGGWPAGFAEIMTQENRNKSWVLKAGTLYAFIRYPYGNGMPQLSLNSDTESMIPLLGSPVEDDTWRLNEEGRRLQLPKNRTTITRDIDLDRYVELRSLTWRGNGIFEMTNGESIRLYDQFKEFAVNVNNLIVGQKYYVRGIIGLVGADLAIFPVADILRCPATPTLYSPNSFAGTPDAQGYITANAISDVIEIRAEGASGENSTFKYRIEGGELQDATGDKITVNLLSYNYAVTTGVRLEVFSVLNGLTSMEPAKVRLVKKVARDVESIHAYKEGIFNSTLDNSSNSVYRMTGNAIIEEVTDRFIYVRDYSEAHMGEGAEEYIHRLLIRNTNGWNAEIYDLDANETRPLKEGDVITGFAIVPLEVNGNLLGESTGYARTFNFVDHIEGYSFDPEVRNIDYTESSDGNGTAFKFTEKDQMCLITLAGVTVSRTDNPDPDATDRYVYTLDIAGDQPTQMNFNIFTFRGGFSEAYFENTKYNITGVVLIDGSNGFSFAPIEFTGAAGKLALPDVYLSTIAAANRDDIEQPFVNGSIVMNAKTTTVDGLAVDGDVKIYYSIDGLDPLNNLGSRIEYTDEIPLSDNTVEIRAFASAPGYTPSDVVVRRFVKNSRDVQFILNFLQWTEPGGTYRFTGRTRVAGIGGQYLFLYDILGNYLPVFRTDGWDNRGINKGDMMTGFTMGHKIDENGNHLAVADGFADTFVPTAATEQDNVDYLPVPVDASELNINVHPGRMVRLMNVTVHAPQAKADGAGTTLNPEIWTITESNDNATHPMMVGKLGKVTIHERDASGVEVGEPTNDFVDGDSYHIIGYVMLGTPGRDVQMEMWPVQATHLEMTEPVEVSFDSGTTVADEPNEFGEIEASFQGMTLVRLTCPTRGATIMYAFGDNPDNLNWYQYQHPFAVTSSTYMHAKAVNGLNVESGHTHVVFTALQPSGDIAFSATAGDGKTTLTIAPQGEVAEGTEIWYSIGNERSCSRLYRTPMTFTESTTVYACLQEPGKARGAVSTIRVMVIPASAGTAKVSGRVRFITSTDEQTEAVYLNILPEDASVVDYDIYYTTNANVSLTPQTGTLFTNAIEVTEATYFLAILVERGKEAGVVCGMNVWINPTGIDDVATDAAAAAEIDVDGNNIIAPTGSKIFTVNGGRVSATSLRPGVYIVVLPDGRAAKVAIL